jgi:hypothetical protein
MPIIFSALPPVTSTRTDPVTLSQTPPMYLRYALLLAGAIAMRTMAQPTLTNGQASPSPGESYLYHSGDYIYPGFTWSGGDMDFTAFTQTGSTNRQFVAPSSTTYGSYFPSATVAEVAGPGAWGYYRTTATGFEQLGLRTAASSLICASGTNVVPYPISYEDQVYEDYGCTGLSGAVPFTRTGSNTVQADGYGDLITPYGTFANVLRISIFNNYNDVGANIDEEANVSSYLWYKPGITVPVMGIYDIFTTSGGILQYTWMLDASGIGIEEGLRNDIGMELYPNPASNTVSIVFGARGRVALDLVDDAGRTVRTQDAGNHVPGIYKNDLDLDGVAPGLYTVRATDDHGGCGTKRLVVLAQR